MQFELNLFDWQTIIALAMVAASVWYLLSTWRNSAKVGGGSCGSCRRCTGPAVQSDLYQLK